MTTGRARRHGRAHGGARGSTLMELLVALLLFALTAAALAQTLVAAQRLRASSERWMRATQLAEDRLERVRAGDRSDDAGPIGVFTRSWHGGAADGAPGIERVDVAVEWEDRGPQRFELTELQQRAR